MRKLVIGIGAAAALMAQPLAAQDEQADKEVMAALSQVFEVEPLTPEEEARLPLARRVIDQLMPVGTLSEVMGSMFDGALGPLMKMAQDAPPDLTEHIGYSASELELDEEQVIEIAGIVDPQWRERRERQGALMQGLMVEMMNAMEPAMRQGMSEAYAIAFTVEELNDISAFFATESGATFARKSYQLANDPRIMSAAMKSMPAMFEQFAEMEQKMADATADLGEKRSFATLAQAQKARIMAITGLSEEDLEIGMEVAADQADLDTPF